MQIKSIFFPTDFSERSLHALPYALEMAKTYNAKLYILHVLYDLESASELSVPGAKTETVYEELANIAERELKNLKHYEQMTSTDVEFAVCRGLPYQEILRFAAEKAVDLIIIGTHGKTGKEKVTFGSTAQRVIRRAPCPVLTVV